jgi:hypothetical protein
MLSMMFSMFICSVLFAKLLCTCWKWEAGHSDFCSSLIASVFVSMSGGISLLFLVRDLAIVLCGCLF